ncbi:MAG: hypothetical protein M3Y37_04225 [Chloroflexota bacterium]|nr:hypothetical protein [Chloroflexota bacterium]
MAPVVASPNNWGIVGHAHQVRRLRQRVERGFFPAAMLVTGTPGVGRKALIEAMARATLCPERPAGEFCGSCSVCNRIGSGSHPDFQVWSIARQDIEGSGTTAAALSIETIRSIAASTAIRPQEGDHRFIVIDDAETLGDAAQQAMLKMLEDVPAYLTIALLSATPGAMLDTVVSRCVEIPLQLVSTTTIRAAIDSADAAAIAELAAGRPGWAIAAQSDPALIAAEREAQASLQEWLAKPRRDRLIEAYQRGNRTLGGDRIKNRQERDLLLANLGRLQVFWRDAILSLAGAGEAAFNPDRLDGLGGSDRISLASAHKALLATVTCQQDLLRNVRPRLALQAMVNRWPNL